jgi:hypothetical protein
MTLLDSVVNLEDVGSSQNEGNHDEEDDNILARDRLYSESFKIRQLREAFRVSSAYSTPAFAAGGASAGASTSAGASAAGIGSSQMFHSPPSSSSTSSIPPAASPSSSTHQSLELHPLSVVYFTMGRCLDLLENRPRAVRAFTMCVAIDVGCTEAVDYLVAHSLLSREEKTQFYRSIVHSQLSSSSPSSSYSSTNDHCGGSEFEKRGSNSSRDGNTTYAEGGGTICGGRWWLEGYYRFTLLGEDVDAVASFAGGGGKSLVSY